MGRGDGNPLDVAVAVTTPPPRRLVTRTLDLGMAVSAPVLAYDWAIHEGAATPPRLSTRLAARPCAGYGIPSRPAFGLARSTRTELRRDL